MSKFVETINNKSYERHTNPIKAIRQKCVEDCCCGYVNEVTNCTSYSCPLYNFRFGKNPYRTKRELTEEQKHRQREILSKSRSKQSELVSETDVDL